MRRKDDVPVQVKAADGHEGRFSALVSVWDVVDRVGDRMMAGSFTETLRKWRDRGKRIPVVWSHQTDSPDTVIGSADPQDVRETTSGLQVDGILDIADNPLARRAFELLKNGTVTGWSFGYIPKKQRRRNGANEVHEVDLLELGPTVSPVNAATATLGVKGFDEDGHEEPNDLARLSDAELRARSEAAIAGVTKADKPIQIVTFEC